MAETIGLTFPKTSKPKEKETDKNTKTKKD